MQTLSLNSFSSLYLKQTTPFILEAASMDELPLLTQGREGMTTRGALLATLPSTVAQQYLGRTVKNQGQV